ncbi:hypothetical protein E8L90_09420 [Brevibacillus antibioticus]|uniref:Uncharacterized protein n=1 Tax=Brevibacillus antibioticus TaxID=2570228 RepID=A0A4U2Y523_9BACL|nr:hypothetical protein [Brevibacillus antibioticus]TKI55646.1 hypothetical protein E8L90_09420 [Brevibacillus antibioticus]
MILFLVLTIGNHGQFDTIYVHEEDKDWLANGSKAYELSNPEDQRDITIPTPETFQSDTNTPFQGEATGLFK